MAGKGRIRMENRSGAVVVIVALMLVVIVGMAAFAIDTGMLFSARSDAQRAADAAALAAASAFLDKPFLERAEAAEERGVDFATRNQLLHGQITPDEVTIELVNHTLNGLRVRATVRRQEVSTFFAGIWGKNTLPVAAVAEAEVRLSGKADCIKPLGIPSDQFEAAEVWSTITLYKPKDNDLIIVNLNDKEQPGVGDVWKQFAAECDDSYVALDDMLLYEKPGDSEARAGEGWAQVRKGVDDLNALDSGLTWNSVDGFNRDDWASSVRVGTVLVYDRESDENGTNQVPVVNFARVFFLPTVGNNVNNFEVKVVLLPAPGLPDNCEGAGCADNLYISGLVK